jgi:hypothetical protein
MNTGTQQRDRVASMAATDPEPALALALKIADSWFRCQALSMAAVHVPDRRRRERAIDQAFAAANDLPEPNRVVTVSSWPVKALALTGNMPRVSSETGRLLQIMSSERSPVRRADALRYLLGAVSIAPAAVFIRVAQALGEACLEPLEAGTRNRKGDSLLEMCLPGIARFDRALAQRLLEGLASSRSVRCARAIEELKDVPLTTILSWPHFGHAAR